MLNFVKCKYDFIKKINKRFFSIFAIIFSWNERLWSDKKKQQHLNFPKELNQKTKT